METAVSVIIPAHSDKRWDALSEAVESVRRQSRPAAETILSVDHNEALLARATAQFPDVQVVSNSGRRGASGTRNVGVSAAKGDLVAFLDDDAVADERWLELLCAPLADPAVLGTGGGVRPVWPAAPPRWFPDEFGWVVGASYRGMPQTPEPVRNVWGLNMAMRRELFLAVGGFRDGFGKLGDRSRPEDTELCLRVKQENPAGHWLYVPDAMVGHHVPANRATVRFFLNRCWHEGRGKAELAALAGSGEATSTERDYVRRILPRGVARGVRAALGGGDWSGLLRTAGIVGGLGATATGMVAGQLAAARRQGRNEAAAPSALTTPAALPRDPNHEIDRELSA